MSQDAPLGSASGRVKKARRLARRTTRAELRLFLAEGSKAIGAALELPGCVTEVFATAGATGRYTALQAAAVAAAVPWHQVDDRAMTSLAGTVTPQGVVAVCQFVDRPVAEVLAASPRSRGEAAVPTARLLAVLVDVRDPGNAGTVIRCADAAGADAVVLAGSSVDPYNPKAVRATVGSLFHVPIALVDDPRETLDDLRRRGFTVLAADSAGETDLDDASDNGLLADRTAWVFGNEAHGLADGLAAAADHRVRIPIHGRAESLNLSTAAAVCLYASARAQRRA